MMTRPHIPVVPALRVAMLCVVLASISTTWPPFAHQNVVTARDIPAARRVPSHRVSRANAAQEPLVAVALRGDIYAVPADGSSPPRRLTDYGHNGSPALSPHGRLIAYLSVPRGGLDKYGHASSHNVWIVPMNGASDGSSGYKITPTNLNADRGALAWAPDGQHLAYVENSQGHSSVVVVDYQGRHSTAVLRFTSTTGDAIAWSSDSRRLAIMPPQPYSGDTTTAAVAIAAVDGSMHNAITVRFPSDTFSGRQPGGRGSSPDLNNVAWAPDGHHLVVQTFGNGEGSHITGLWQVADSGGIARLFVGTLAGVRQGYYGTGAYAFLNDAPRFAFSPDGHSLLINRLPGGSGPRGSGPDGQNGFWLANADGTQGHLLNPAPLACCTLAQSVWLTDSSGLAFVSLQVLKPASGTPSSGPPIQARLYSLGLNGTSHLLYQLRLLYELTDPDQGKMEIAPAFGCVECGA